MIRKIALLIVIICSILAASTIIIFKFKSAEFKVISIEIFPSNVTVGQPVKVSATIKNTGKKDGIYVATLKINGVEIENKKIKIASGEIKTVTFTIIKEIEGIYTVEIGGLTKTFQVKGLRIKDLQPKIGDKWQYKYMENGAVMLMSLEITGIRNITIGNQFLEAYIIEGSADVKNWGNIIPENFSVISCDVNITIYQGKEGLSSQMIMDMTLVLEHQGIIFGGKWKQVSVTEVVSGNEPEIIEIGSKWSTTERIIKNTTLTFMGETTTETEEFTSTVIYECIEVENVTIEAGTFYCYKVKKTIVNEEGYSVDYYSIKTKLPVKSVKYLDDEIVSLMELVSYNVSNSRLSNK